ncbi:hypothetical protein [Streptomyces sp. NPDC023838]|uniref:hypothetical protein n=1 Tax=Streptomyces sp. NPDC023838 TaxID=3154325 RepID=UPI0033ED3F90
MAPSIKKRTAAGVLTAAAVIAGTFATASPASASMVVTCPPYPTWSHGIELWGNDGRMTCIAGSPDPTTYLQIDHVNHITSGVNRARVAILGSPDVWINPGQSIPVPDVTVLAVEIRA